MSNSCHSLPATPTYFQVPHPPSSVLGKRKEIEPTEAPSLIQTISNKYLSDATNEDRPNNMEDKTVTYLASKQKKQRKEKEKNVPDHFSPIGSNDEKELYTSTGLKWVPVEVFLYHIGLKLGPQALLNLFQCDREIYSMVTTCTALVCELDQYKNHRLMDLVIQEMLTITDAERKELGAIDNLEILKRKVLILCKIAKALADHDPKQAVAIIKDARLLVHNNSKYEEDIEDRHLMYMQNLRPGINLRQDLLWLNLKDGDSEQDYLHVLETGPTCNDLDDAIKIADSFSGASVRDDAISMIVQTVAIKGGGVEEIDCLQKLVGTIQSPNIKDDVIGRIAFMQAPYDLEEARKSVNAMNNQISKDYALVAIIRIQSTDNLPKALSMIDLINSLKAKDNARSVIAKKIASIDSVQALEIAFQIQDIVKKVEALCAIVHEPSLPSEKKKSVLNCLFKIAENERCHKHSLYQIAAAFYLTDKRRACVVMNQLEWLEDTIHGWLWVSSHLKEQHPALAQECLEKAQAMFVTDYPSCDPQDIHGVEKFLLAFVKQQVFFDLDKALKTATSITNTRCSRRAFLAVIKKQASQDIPRALAMIDSIKNARTQAEGLCEIAWLTSKNDVKLTHDILRRILSIFKERPDGFLDPEKSDVKGKALILVAMMQILAKTGEGI